MGSGGGGSSGAVSHSAYLEDVHADWLNNSGVDTLSDSITDVMNTAIGGSPWAALTAYDPSADITAYEAVLTAFKAILTGIVDTTGWAALFTAAAGAVGAYTPITVADAVAPADVVLADETVVDINVADITVGVIIVPDAVVPNMVDAADVPEITDADIIVDTAALADQIDDEIAAKILPRYRRGMQDIGAVVSSAFPIGEAIIEGFRDRDVAKHASGLRVQAAFKNADIRRDNERIHFDVRQANLSKDVQIALANMTKDIQVDSAVMNKEVQVELGNMNKDVMIADKVMGKNTSMAGINLTKSVQIAQMNLSKAMDIVKLNKSKDIEVSRINTTMAADYKRMHLEGTGQILRLMLQRIAWEDDYARMFVEGKRIKIVAKKEQTDQNATIDEKDGLWDLEVFQFGANLMAGIAGGTSGNKLKTPSVAQSVIGGAMSGAATGAMIGGQAGNAVGPGYGALIGAVLGAAAGWLAS
jgi:hypothetical protein